MQCRTVKEEPGNVMKQNSEAIDGDGRLCVIGEHVFRHEPGRIRNCSHGEEHESVRIDKPRTGSFDELQEIVVIHPGYEDDAEAQGKPEPRRPVAQYLMPEFADGMDGRRRRDPDFQYQQRDGNGKYAVAESFEAGHHYALSIQR